MPAQAALAGEGGAAAPANGIAYARLPPITIRVIGSTNRAEKQVNVMVQLELESGKTEDMLEPYRRAILDAYNVTLKGLYDEQYADTMVPPDVLKSSLLDAATGVTGPGLVHAVLLIGVGERRVR